MDCTPDNTKNQDRSKQYYNWQKRQSVRIASVLLRQADAQHDQRGHNRAVRQISCSEWLEVNTDGDAPIIVRTAACKGRLCPWCAHRKAIKAYWTNYRIAAEIERQHPGIKWILVTLTVRNVPLHTLAATLSRLSAGFARLNRLPITSAWQGYIRSLEVTYNSSEGTYHPHLHAMIPVTPSYWHKDYISKRALRQAWQQILDLDYLPQCDIRLIHSAGGVAEVSKYASKPNNLPDAALLEVDNALLGKRMISYGGLPKLAKRALLLPDPEQIDGTEDNGPLPPADATEWWLWHDDLLQYVSHGQPASKT